MKASTLRKGMFFRFQNNIHEVLEYQLVTPGNLRSFVSLKHKDVKTGKILSTKLGSSDDVEQITIDSRPMQYLYSDHEGYHFMDMQDFHTVCVSVEMVGEDKGFLVENMELAIAFEDETPVKLQLPRNIVLEVAEAAPGIKGDSVSNTLKPVTLSTGLKISVPLFINQGDKVKIDTIERTYLGRE